MLIPLLLLVGLTTVKAETPSASLDHGYQLMYNLDFAGAQQEFTRWQETHQEDPLGPVSEAAGLLFAELNRLGVLESQFFIKDSSFEARPKLSPDPAIRARLDAALGRAEGLARRHLENNPKDLDALFATTLSAGLKADYAALIQKRNLASLRYARQGSYWADKLLALDPGYYDAYLATGVAKYVVGSQPAPIRWLLRLGGFSGDKKKGIRDLELTAQRGRFLAPFARILLAIAYLRETDKTRARELLTGLRDEFPSNPLFARELARLDSSSH